MEVSTHLYCTNDDPNLDPDNALMVVVVSLTSGFAAKFQEPVLLLVQTVTTNSLPGSPPPFIHSCLEELKQVEHSSASERSAVEPLQS